MSFDTFYPDAEFVVVFTSVTAVLDSEYAEMNALLETESEKIPGFLGLQSVRDAEGRGVTLSYWRDAAAIELWRSHIDHMRAKKEAQTRWYSFWTSYICEVQSSNAKR